MKRVLLIACLTIPALLPAQRNLEVGLAGGVTHYYGDLGNWDGPIQWNSARPAMSVTFRDFLNNPKRYVTRAITVEGRLSWHRIGYDETEPTGGKSGLELQNFNRGLNFRTDLFGASGHLVLNAYREPYQPLFQQRFFAYFSIGAGIYYGRPKADLFRGDIALGNQYFYWDDGTMRDVEQYTPGYQTANVVERDGKYETDLYSWHTEGGWGDAEGNNVQRSSPWHFGMPLGFGLRYMVTKQVSIGAEFSYIYFISDKIDDVSDRYSTHDEIGGAFPNDSTQQFLARYVSDPSGFGTDGTTGIKTSRRGNPGLPDYFSYLMVEVSYKFKRRPSRRIFVNV
ncbi:MAG: hypothetical protein IPO17_13155 [Flavobacteriales bacterium]|nr:hypothetical protein [Flavobacteriales bacterium]